MNSKEQNKMVAVPNIRKRHKKPVVVAFHSPTANVTQDDLLTERVFFQKALRAVERWQEKCRMIRTLLEAGATVESGIYRADLIEHELETPLGFTFPITRLVVS